MHFTNKYFKYSLHPQEITVILPEATLLHAGTYVCRLVVISIDRVHPEARVQPCVCSDTGPNEHGTAAENTVSCQGLHYAVE